METFSEKKWKRFQYCELIQRKTITELSFICIEKKGYIRVNANAFMSKLELDNEHEHFSFQLRCIKCMMAP